ncbi:Fe-S cluster assembly sulfur transfer protein SufU [Candidatus Binatus sp.]
MSGRLNDIYPETLKRHYEDPRNYRPMEGESSKASAVNPVCGDEVTIYLKGNQSKVNEVTYQGHLCAISKASASLMSEAVRGRDAQEISVISRDFEAMMRGSDAVSLGDLDALRSIRAYRVRIRCALLPWEALRKACEVLA